MVADIESDSIYDDTNIAKCVRNFRKKKTTISRQIRNRHRQLLERIWKPHQRIVRKCLYDLTEDLNSSTNLKILEFMVDDPNVQLSENDLCYLLEELTLIREPYEYIQNNLVKFGTRIKIILSVLEYIVFNIETFRIEAGFYKEISNRLEGCVSHYRNYSSITLWATPINYYKPNEETIHKYNVEFLLEYIFNILKILRENGLLFRKANLQVEHFLKVLVRSFRYFGTDARIGGPSLLPLEQSWERLRNTCNFGNLVSPFFTDYYILKKIKMIIQTWSYEGDRIMMSNYGKWLHMEFMWVHADNIWFEEMKCSQKNSNNDEILTQYQLKNVMFLFGILDLMENYIAESEQLSTLALIYYFAKESLQKTRSAPIQIKSTAILLKLYFRDGNFSKIIEQDFESYLQGLDDDDAAHFKSFLLVIKPRFYQEFILNDTLFENFQGTILLPRVEDNGKISSTNKYDDWFNKNMISIIADEMTCSVVLEPVESICILGCEHKISCEAFPNLSRLSRYHRCPQCRQNIQDHECVFLPRNHVYSYFYAHFVAFGIVGSPPIAKVTKPHYLPTPLISPESPTIPPQNYFDFEDIQLEDLPNQRVNIHNDLSSIWRPLIIPKKLHPAYNEALKALNSRHYEETVLWLTCLLQHYPNSYSVRCDRAFISLLLRRHFLALKDLNIALRLKKKNPHAWCLRGEIFRKIGYFDDALLDLNKALQLAPNDAISYGIRGALFYEMKKFNESLEDLNYSLEQLPNNGFCLGFRGATLNKLGSNNDALADFNKALEINPEDIFVLIERAKLYHVLCLDNSALIDINNVLSINPHNHNALLIRGEIYIALENDSDALLDISKSLEMKPNNVNALKIRATLYYRMNRNEEALNDLDKALNLKSNDFSIYELRGEIYRTMYYFKEAIDNFNQMLKLDSHNIFALYYRGATKYDQKLYEEALVDLNKALELRQENNSFMLKTRAKIFIALERYHEAFMDQNKVLEIEPNDHVVLLERSEVCRKLGLYDKAHVNSGHRRIALKPTHSC